jgi:hypothetical protein
MVRIERVIPIHMFSIPYILQGISKFSRGIELVIERCHNDATVYRLGQRQTRESPASFGNMLWDLVPLIARGVVFVHKALVLSTPHLATSVCLG